MILATLEEIKELNDPAITGDSFDELLSVYMEAIGTTFQNYCGRKFLADTYTEYYRGSGQYIYLLETPVRQVNNIWVDVDAEFNEEDKLQPTDYVVFPDGQIWSLLFPFNTSLALSEYGATFSAKNIKIEYEGGYDDVGMSGDYPIPGDLKLAFIRQVQYDIKRRKDIGLTSVTFKDGTIQKQHLADLLPQVSATLDYYRHLNI